MTAYAKFAYIYDRLMNDMPYPMWLRFIRECWENYGVPKTAVDLGCGTGNLTIPLARMGLAMTGIDLSEDMLAVAEQKAERLNRHAGLFGGGSVRWIHQDMREWRLPFPVDAVISCCDCLNYLLDGDDVLQTFRQTCQGLNDGGVYLFDVHTPLQLERYAEAQPFVLNEEDAAYIWTCEWDEARNEITHDLTIFSKLNAERGALFQRIEETHVQRAYPLDWLKRSLLAAGFGKVDCFADFRWHAPRDDAQRAFFVAVK